MFTLEERAQASPALAGWCPGLWGWGPDVKLDVCLPHAWAKSSALK